VISGFSKAVHIQIHIISQVFSEYWTVGPPAVISNFFHKITYVFGVFASPRIFFLPVTG